MGPCHQWKPLNRAAGEKMEQWLASQAPAPCRRDSRTKPPNNRTARPAQAPYHPKGDIIGLRESADQLWGNCVASKGG